MYLSERGTWSTYYYDRSLYFFYCLVSVNSGKSTISALLQGLYQPTKGRIVIDGCPMDDLDLRHLREYMAVVTQDPR